MKQNRQKNNMIKTAADTLFDRGFMMKLRAGVKLFRLFCLQIMIIVIK